MNSLLNLLLESLSIPVLTFKYKSSLRTTGKSSNNITICQPKSVLNGSEKSPGLFNLNACDSNSETILPTPNGGNTPPLTAVDLSSENLSATSAKRSPFFNKS